MTKQEFAIWVDALRTYYPKENLLPNGQAVTLWYMKLNDIPYDVASAVLDKWVDTNKWSPSIADIRGMIADAVAPVDLWSEAWEKVLGAVRKFGMYREQEALDTFDDITKRTVKQIGFYNICTSENIVSDRKQFRDIYEQLSQRAKNDACVAPNVMAAIQNTTRKMIGDKHENE